MTRLLLTWKGTTEEGGRAAGQTGRWADTGQGQHLRDNAVFAPESFRLQRIRMFSIMKCWGWGAGRGRTPLPRRGLQIRYQGQHLATEGTAAGSGATWWCSEQKTHALFPVTHLRAVTTDRDLEPSRRDMQDHAPGTGLSKAVNGEPNGNTGTPRGRTGQTSGDAAWSFRPRSGKRRSSKLKRLSSPSHK